MYKNLYKNIDLKVYGREKQVEYDWIVKPGGNPGDIRFMYRNVKSTRLDDQGNLIIKTAFGELLHKKPVSYQTFNTQGANAGESSQGCYKEQRDVNVTFKKIDENTYGFDVGKYDKSCELIIDPVVLVESKYFGGNKDDWCKGIAVDSSECVYVTGETISGNFPTLNQYQKNRGGWDAFVTKLDPTRTGDSALVYSTYFGGAKNDDIFAIAVDNSGNVYATGPECETSFYIYGDCFGVYVIQIDTTRKGTSSLINSLYMEEYIFGFGITRDSSGNLYVAGADYDFRGYLKKLAPSFDIIYSIDFDYICEGVSLDSRGYVYVAGGGVFAAKLISDPYELPTVTTESVSFLTETSAFCSGQITFDGGVPVTGRGVCWSTSKNPTLSDNHTMDGIGTGPFTGSLTGLLPNTTYYARAYATNLAGTAYGKNAKFTTLEIVPPYIRLSRSQLNFGAVIGGTCTASQTFFISSSGEGSLNWSASVSGTLLKASPLNGTDNTNVAVSVDISGLNPGSYSGSITITDPEAENSPVRVFVQLEVKQKSQELPPFGYLEPPQQGASVYSSIPVTGWALDDIGMSSVKIYRQPVKGEKGLVYIGDSIFVEGARPDVEAQFPTYPQNYRAGWGYMMLTNFLPNNGNGTFVITAIATDSTGNKVTLGSKTIICDNVNAFKPFGAIDTPNQGGSASGNHFVNWGWVLTPQPNHISIDGSTINIYIDGVNKGHPTYNIFRQDIAALFPNYANSNGAVGYGFLNTFAYENGVHTIQWTATDSAGNTDGIGSRYFTIQNTGSDNQTNPQASLSLLPLNLIPFKDSYHEHILLQRGYNPKSKPERIYPGADDVFTIEINQLERIELRIAQPMVQLSGYQIVKNQFRPLPIGSFLDFRNGIFYWQAGAGFFGEFSFIFSIDKLKKKKVKIVILPELLDT